jgi:hypothetical protein
VQVPGPEWAQSLYKTTFYVTKTIRRVRNVMEIHFTFYSAHGNLTAKVIYVHHVIMHGLSSTTSQFDGNISGRTMRTLFLIDFFKYA